MYGDTLRVTDASKPAWTKAAANRLKKATWPFRETKLSSSASQR